MNAPIDERKLGMENGICAAIAEVDKEIKHWVHQRDTNVKIGIDRCQIHIEEAKRIRTILEALLLAKTEET